MTTLPICRIVTVHTFRGDRTSTFRQHFYRAVDEAQNRRGPGPTAMDCLFFAGHAGVSTDADSTVYGFNPTPGVDPPWRMFQHLRNGGAYAGVVHDDTAVFTTAGQSGLTVLTFDIALSPLSFQTFVRKLTDECKQSEYSYGYPDGDGDCNCATWLERLGLPLLTGRLDEFADVTGVAAQWRRRFGQCV
jgi:hypothetical protein